MLSARHVSLRPLERADLTALAPFENDLELQFLSSPSLPRPRPLSELMGEPTLRRSDPGGSERRLGGGDEYLDLSEPRNRHQVLGVFRGGGPTVRAAASPVLVGIGLCSSDAR